MKNQIILAILILTFAIFGVSFFVYQEKSIQEIQEAQEMEKVSQPSEEVLQLEETSQNLSSETIEIITSPSQESLPKKFKLDVPFLSQAPLEIWDDDHNEACEEAAILMIDIYLKEKELIPEMVDKEILEMIDYQKENWQGHFDLSVEKIEKLAEEFYGYKNTKIKYDVSIDDIKREIVSGNPVILPTAGRMLFGPLSEGKNPYYRSPGPLYHVLVAIGWDDDKGVMVVNDPGTKHGKEFSFKYEVLENAIHDWNNGNVDNGKKAMVVLFP